MKTQNCRLESLIKAICRKLNLLAEFWNKLPERDAQTPSYFKSRLKTHPA